MTFEEWWEKEVDAWDTGVKTIAEEAWQQGYNKGYSVGFDESEVVFEAGVQEGINRMYFLYDICPECRATGGRHQMDCGRQR